MTDIDFCRMIQEANTLLPEFNNGELIELVLQGNGRHDLVIRMHDCGIYPALEPNTENEVKELAYKFVVNELDFEMKRRN